MEIKSKKMRKIAENAFGKYLYSIVIWPQAGFVSMMSLQEKNLFLQEQKVSVLSGVNVDVDVNV
jgi:hypothetical protein